MKQHQKPRLVYSQGKKTRSPRVIKTRYYDTRSHHFPVKENSAADPRRAVAFAVLAMQEDRYSAVICEVWNDETGELYAIIKRKIARHTIEILYKKDFI